eukprot:1194986-Prorocentrum_minimum.AAC.7
MLRAAVVLAHSAEPPCPRVARSVLGNHPRSEVRLAHTLHRRPLGRLVLRSRNLRVSSERVSREFFPKRSELRLPSRMARTRRAHAQENETRGRFERILVELLSSYN